MIKQVFTVAALTLLAINTAFADQKPGALPSDSRIKQFVYNENTVYRLDLHLKAITSVQFASGEEVKSILIGDSASWEVVRLKSGNVISVKPRVANALSNLTIYTDRRVYTFELRTVGDVQRSHRAAKNQNYRTTFIYPSSSQVQEFNRGIGNDGGKNHDYFAAGEGRFKPIEVYDNGRQTFFKFAPNAPRPAIFKVEANGKESLINLRANGDFAIVDSVNDLWTVRIGDEALCIASGPAIKTLPYRLRKTAKATS